MNSLQNSFNDSFCSVWVFSSVLLPQVAQLLSSSESRTSLILPDVNESSVWLRYNQGRADAGVADSYFKEDRAWFYQPHEVGILSGSMRLVQEKPQTYQKSSDNGVLQ